MSKVIKDLGFLGEQYQFRLVKAFMDDAKFFRDVVDVVDQNMFTDFNLKTYVGVLKDYFNENSMLPSYDLMLIKLKDLHSKSEIDSETIDEVVNKIKTTSIEADEYIKKRACDFFKQQNLIKLINEAYRDIKSGDMAKIETLDEKFRVAITVGRKHDMGEKIYDDIEELLSPDYRKPVPTGMSLIDEYLEGGLGKGELGIIIGPSGFGKTTLSTFMASNASTFKCEQNDFNGYKVVQIFFEDTYKQIKRKHAAKVTETEARNLSKEDYVDKVRERLANNPNKELIEKNLILKKFPSGETNVVFIKQYLQKLITSGFKPDLVIIDYFECIAPTHSYEGGNEWKTENRTMRQLESMASDLDIALWIPTQGTKDSLNGKLVTMSQAGGSVGKVQIGHVIISISRMMGDINSNLAKIGILKNRSGISDIILDNVDFNNGTCIISTENAVEFKNFDDFTTNETQKKDTIMAETMKRMVKP